MNDTSFNLYVTQAEEKVLWNVGEKGRKPGRLAVPQQRITVRADGISRSPYIPLIYLTVLSSKLTAMALADVLPAVDLSGYCDERVMASLGERIAGVLDRMTEMQDGEEGGNPVSWKRCGPGKNGRTRKPAPPLKKLASPLFYRFFFQLPRFFRPDGAFHPLKFALQQFVHQLAFGLPGLERRGRNVRNVHLQIIQITLIGNAEGVTSEPFPNPFVAFRLVFGFIIHFVKFLNRLDSQAHVEVVVTHKIKNFSFLSDIAH